MRKFSAKYGVMILAGVLLVNVISFAQVRITTPRNGDVSPLNSQFVAGTGPTGMPVYLFVDGVPSDTTTVRPDGKFEFIGVKTHAGPVKFTAVIRYSNGAEQKDERTMHIVGSPDSLIIESNRDAIPADGRSKVQLSLKLVDKWGYQISNSYFATLDGNEITEKIDDQDPTTFGVQRRIINGAAVIDFTAPTTAGEKSIKIAVGSLTREYRYTFSTPVEPLMLVGSASASGSFLSTSGNLTGLKNEDKLNDGFFGDGRLAFYGRGSVWGDYLLTASYDNKRKEDRLFKEVDPDVLYSLYGDNSSVDYTAQSNNPFFVKIEQNRSYALFGDFNTGYTQNELARYDRTFNGVKSHYEAKTGTADLFVTLTDRKVQQDEIRGQGISGYYFLGKSNVVAGTEKVRIETRDKRHNEIIISSYDKSRFGDYEIDYEQGTLFFKQPVPGIDGSGNPVYIIVTYEATVTNAADYSYVAGVQGEKEIADGLRIGGTAVHDKSNSDFTLLGANTKFALKNDFAFNGEFARGYDKFNDGGNAWKVDLSGSPVQKLQLKSYFRKVESGFMNETMGAGGISNESGSTKYGGGITYSGIAQTKISTDGYRTLQSANGSDVVINSIVGSVERSFGETSTVSTRVENISYESSQDTVKKQSTLVSLRGTVKPTDRLNVLGEYEYSLSSSATDEVKPSNATVGAEYRVFDPVTLSLSQKFYSNNASSSLFGVTSNLGYGTAATARYQIENGINGNRNQLSIGLKNTLHLTDDLTSNVSYERTKALDRNVVEAKTNDNDAVSLGLEYLPKQSYKATIKGEWAKNTESIRRSLTFGGDIRLANDFTLIDKLTYFEEARNSVRTNSVTFADGNLSSNQPGMGLSAGLLKKFNNAVGLAYRPVDFDWLNAIGKFEKKMEFNGIVEPQSSYDVNIVSLHVFVEPMIGLEIGTKYAMKYAIEESFGLKAATMTDFYLVRAEYDLRWNNFDVAAEYRVLNSRIVDQANSNSIKNGYSAEIGNVVFENIHVGVGYNFVGTQERDLVGKDYWSAGPFISVRAKFTEKILELFNK